MTTYSTGTTAYTTNTPSINRPDLNGNTDFWKVGYDNTLPTSGRSRSTYEHGFMVSTHEAERIYQDRAAAEAIAYTHYMNGDGSYFAYENAMIYREDAFNAYMASLTHVASK